MLDAPAATATPPRSPARKLFGPLIEWRTYAAAGYLLALFPLGLVYFITLVVMLAVGFSLVWTLIGPPLLLITLYLSRWAGDAEAWLIRHIQGIPLRRPPTTIERGSYRAQVRDRLTDPTTWTGLLYLFVQFPLGIASFVLLVTWLSVTGSLIAAPFVASTTEFTIGGDAPEAWVFNSPADAWWLPLIGLPLLVLGVHAIRGLFRLHGMWARLMLGSRAPHITPGAPLAGPTPEDDGSPQQPPPAPTAAELPDLEAAARPAPIPTLPVLAPIAAGVSDAVAAQLTPREREVLQLMARGYSNAEIAEAFVLSEGTVKTHVKRVLAKLDLRDRTQAAVWAFDHGFVQPATAEAAAPEPLPFPLAAPR